MPRIYTKTGDDGTTGLLYGGRVSKSDPAAEAYGTTDEAVAALGLARALCEDEALRQDLLALQRELFVVGADLATNPKKRKKLTPAVSLVTPAMVKRLEGRIDDLVAAHPLPRCSSSRGRTPAAPRWTWRAASSAGRSAASWSSRPRGARSTPKCAAISTGSAT